MLAEHENPGEATLVVLGGRVRLVGPTGAWEGRQGDLLVIPQARPHDEQLVTGSVLQSGWPAVLCPSWPQTDWPALLDRAAALDGEGWSRWCDGEAGERFAELALRLRGGLPAGARS